MSSLDEFVRKEYGNDVQYLVKAGCEDIKNGLDYHRESLYDAGLAKIRKAKELGEVDLSPLVELGYKEALTISSSSEENRGLQILATARKYGADINEERMRGICYRSITNEGDRLLKKAEELLRILCDPERILEECYQIFKVKELNSGYFWMRAFDALIYAAGKGGKVDVSRLPDRDRTDEVIRFALDLRRTEDALRYLKNFAAWGMPIASEETMATLERALKLEK